MTEPISAAAASASTRCARPDCISLREELELLRGDLQEIESENEQLHDKIAQMDGEKQTRSQELMREQTMVNEKIAEKDSEIMRLNQVVRDLSAKLNEVQQARASGVTSSSTSAVPDAGRPSGEPDARMSRIEQECIELRGKNEALEKKLVELRVANARELSASVSAKHAVEQMNQESKDKRSELYKVLKENEMLRAERSELEDALRTTADAAFENESLVKVMYEHQNAYKDAIDEQTIEITQLHTKLEQLEREKQHLEAKLIEMDERESDVEVLLRDAKMKHDMEKAVLRNELDELRKKIQELSQQQQKQKQQSASSGTSNATKQVVTQATLAADTEEMEKQLELLQELRIRDKNTISELNQRLLQQQSDLESLMEHLDVDAAIESAVQSAVAKEQAQNVSMRQENANIKRRLKEQSELLHEMEFRQSQLEKELVEAQTWNAKYEQNAGLEDVMKFQKQLRKQLEKQQQANVKLRHDLNEQIEATGKIHVAFERLKVETGKPVEFEYDDIAVENHLKGELAVNQAVMAQMEHQIQELEADRVRLLQKLREQARLTGHKLYEAHGVTTDQWQLVEEFIDRVKHTPEVAKRLLLSGGEVSGMRVAGGSSSAAGQLSEDAVVKYETEIANSHAENMKLVKEISRLRSELEHAQAQVQAAQVSSQVHSSSETPRTAEKEATEDIRAIREQIQLIVKEQEMQRSRRDLLSTREARTTARVGAEAHQETDADDVESLSSSDDEDIVKQAKKTKTNSRAGRTNDQDDERKDAPGTVLDPKLETEVVEPKSASSPKRNGWASAESIAMAVAKALESRLSQLQGHSQHQQQAREQAESDTPEGAKQTSTGVSDGKKTVAAAAVDTLAFESEEEMALQLDVLKELNVCLDELVRSETQNEDLQQQLTQHEHAFKSLTDQHTVLYQHFFHMHTEYSKSDEDLQREVAEMKHENRDLQLKCQRYESSLYMFAQHHEGDVADPEVQLRSEIVELTRKTAIYEVNEARFRRKYQQLHADLQGAQSQKKMLEQDWLDMEKTLKYRILYLESWKQGADELIERMERTLEKSVLKTFAERQEQAMIQLLHKYNALSGAYSEMHVKFVQMYDLPSQLSRLQHENAVLLAEKRASSGGSKEKAPGGDKISIDPILQVRISQLEHELLVQTQRVKDFEEAQATRVTAANGHGAASSLGLVSMHAAIAGGESATDSRKLELYESDLEKENALLFERISEVEQLYESLTRECAKYKDIAALAATQANTLAKRATQEKSKYEAQEEQLRDLMASSEDHAVVGQLQHQLMQLKANYQQFLLKYDLLSEDQQHATIKAQQLELELENRSKLLSDLRDKSRNQVAVLETTISQVKERDLTVRNTKWEAFRKRLDALEEEMKLEQERRKELEKELEEKEAQLPLLTNLKRSSADGGQSLEVSRLKSRVEALETRERVLMGQLESAAKSATYLEQEEMLQAELADTKKLNGDVMRQLKAAQTRISELIKQNGDLDASRRQFANEKEDLEIELQHAHAQLELLGGGDGSFSGNQRSERSNQSGSHSPLMRKKVGLYEKDQAELQQAAQATIASLKLLVEEKNGLIQEYQKKMVMVRHDAAQVKAQDRLETTQLNKKLYEENQRMISQLKEAMDTIKHLERTGKDKKAIQAAQERHEYVLKEWKQVEISLEKAKQTIKELQMEIEVLKNERDIAEARAGEALEEIVLTKDVVAEQEMINKQLETQLGFVKRDLGKKEDKMKLLRDAIIKLKEEFLKAEDRHAVEIAKAQQVASVNSSRKKKDHREEEEQWKEEKERLESQVQILQEKLELLKKQEAKLKRAAVANAAGRTDTQKARKRDEAASVVAQDAAQVKVLEDEIERLKRVVKERVVSEARAVDDLEKKLRVLEAQNMALREASKSSSVAHAGVAGNERSDEEKRVSADITSKTREQWEVEKKLQRRNEILMLRLKEKHAELDEKEKELEQTKERLAIAQQEQTQLKKAEQKRATVAATGGADGTTSLSASAKEQIDELERQNQYLQETLVLKRREWEEAFMEQMTKYEADLKRLRRRLSQHGVPPAAPGSDERRRGDRQSAERLHMEEQQFLISQEVEDELVVLGDELRAKEQEIILKDTKMMEMALELETLRVEYKRMQRRTSILKSTQQQQQQQSQFQQQGSRHGQSAMKGKATSNSIRSPAQERLELEEVIENMKKVIEKLRSENEKLKKHSVSPGKMDVLRRKLKEHRDAREQLESEVESLRTENAELKKEKLRLQQKLRVASSTLTTAGATSGAGAAQKSSAEVSRHEHEVRELRAQVQDLEERLAHAENEARELKRAIARKETQVQELQFQLEHMNQEPGTDAAAVNDEIIKELEDHVQELEDENNKLQSELAAFDEDFFEEIEDLKYKYAQAVREKQQLERRLLSK